MEEIERLRRESLFWRIVFYISMGILSIWLILKSLGIIQTPFWLEYGVPIGTLILGLFGLFHNLLKEIRTLAVGLAILTARVDHMDEDVHCMKTDINTLKEDVGILKGDVASLKDNMSIVKHKIGI